MGIEVTQDESVTLGLEEWVECRGEIRRKKEGCRC